MNENINLCEILKGHEGETFYSPTFGELTLTDFIVQTIRFKRKDGRDVNLLYNGKWCRDSEEISVFPSKDQRDWNKWVKENKPKIPKTWSDTLFNSSFTVYKLSYLDKDKDYVLTSTGTSPIVKSALALLKIHQLIEVGYGGNVTDEEWNNYEWKFTYQYTKTGIDITSTCVSKNIIAFHTKEQAEEFLSHPENIQLLRDYFMV